MNRSPTLMIVILSAAVAHIAGPAAALTPDEVAVICRQGDANSEKIAKHYADRRRLPAGNVLAVDVPAADNISRTDYDAKLAGPIRQWLDQDGRKGKIRCLLIVGPVPFRVQASQPDEQERHYRSAIAAIIAKDRKRIAELSARLETLAGVPLSTPDKAGRKFDELADRLTSAAKSAATAVNSLPPGPERNKSMAELLQVRLEAFGRADLVQSLKAEPNTPAARLLADLARQMEADAKTIEQLNRPGLTNEQRLHRLELEAANNGLLVRLRLAEADRPTASTSDQIAAVDSELSLLWWPNYPLARWQINPLNWRLAASPPPISPPPTLMVSRLDGPDADTIIRLIDDSVRVESAGLAGTVYIDMAGKTGRGYKAYDDDLLALSAILKGRTKMPVVLEDSDRMMPPGSAKDAALYCGWYSLKKYVPAFTFKPGAVAWHIASFEAQKLRDRQSTLWVPCLLRDGAAATLGPTDEPYLQAFPRPTEFFGLLLTGRYTLAEVYYQTVPMTSWRMLLIGDPLYTPFKKNPQLEIDALPGYKEPYWLKRGSH